MNADFHEKRLLGRTGFPVGRLGVATSYGAPREAFEEAFERGVNYFYWGSRRSDAMAEASRATRSLRRASAGPPQRCRCFSLPSREESSGRGNLPVPPHPFACLGHWSGGSQ